MDWRKFENVLISGSTPYTLEEVDTAIRYVVPASQTAPIEWKKVTNRSFTNILKKFNVTVLKTDVETGKEAAGRRHPLQVRFTAFIRARNWLTPTPPMKTGSSQRNIISAGTIGASVRLPRPRAIS